MKKPIIDINIVESYNQYYLGIGDISEYPQGWNVSVATCEITPPGFDKANVAFTEKAVNFYKSSQLGITCDDDEECVPLPDGIYTVKYSIYPNTVYVVERSFMRTTLIRQQYGRAFLKIDFESTGTRAIEAKRKIEAISALIEGSVAETNRCNYDAAIRNYQKAKQMLDNLDKHCC